MDLCALVGRNVRRHRRAAGLTQEELAHRAGLDRTYLSDIERGIRNPTVLLLRDLAAVFGVHPAALLLEEAAAARLAEIRAPLPQAQRSGEGRPTPPRHPGRGRRGASRRQRLCREGRSSVRTSGKEPDVFAGTRSYPATAARTATEHRHVHHSHSRGVAPRKRSGILPPIRSLGNPIRRWRGRIAPGTSPGMEGVGSRLRSRALELGLSDAEVARRAGLTPTRYGHYVSDYREPDLATLVRICRVLGLRPDELLAYDRPGETRDELAEKRGRVAAFADAMDARTLDLAIPVMQALAATSVLRSPISAGVELRPEGDEGERRGRERAPEP